jgi:YD repeat-containing protein
VIATTNALGHVTLMNYDSSNNKTNEIVFLDGQAYATNRFEYTNDGLVSVSYDALGRSNVFVYGQHGRLEMSTDALGYSTTNYYDDATDVLTGTSDAMGNTTTNYYDGRSLLIGSRDAA